MNKPQPLARTDDVDCLDNATKSNQTAYDQNPRVVVENSPIHGRGVFAQKDLPAFSFIGRYEGPMTDEDGMHVLWLYDEQQDEWVGIDGQNEMRFLNHSDDPNAEWSDLDLYATRWISAGEEITFDYGWDDDDDEGEDENTPDDIDSAGHFEPNHNGSGAIEPTPLDPTNRKDSA